MVFQMLLKISAFLIPLSLAANPVVPGSGYSTDRHNVSTYPCFNGILEDPNPPTVIEH